MRLFGSRLLDGADRIAMDAALDDAFAPLRTTASNIGASRVRAAVRWSRPEPRSARGVALLAHATELSVAAVVSVFVIGASFTVVAPAPDPSHEALSVGSWVLNGRTARLWPVFAPAADRSTDHPLAAGVLKDSAVSVHREGSQPDRPPLGTSSGK